MAEEEGRVHVPHVIDLEVAQVLRRFQLRGEISESRGRESLEQFASYRFVRYPHTVLLPRIWQLRSNLTAYDASYIALAEVLEAPLVTTDAKIAGAPQHMAVIEVIGT